MVLGVSSKGVTPVTKLEALIFFQWHAEIKIGLVLKKYSMQLVFNNQEVPLGGPLRVKYNL